MTPSISVSVSVSASQNCDSGVYYSAKGSYISGTSGTLSVPWPAGHAANDVAILEVESKDDPDTPSGWTEVSGSPVTASSGSTAVRLSVFWKRASGGAEANASVTGCGAHGNAVITTYKNVITSGDPFDVLGTTSKNALNKTLSISGVNATEACNDVLYLVARAGDNGSNAQYSNAVNANLVSVTERVDGS